MLSLCLLHYWNNWFDGSNYNRIWEKVRGECEASFVKSAEWHFCQKIVTIFSGCHVISVNECQSKFTDILSKFDACLSVHQRLYLQKWIFKMFHPQSLLFILIVVSSKIVSAVKCLYLCYMYIAICTYIAYQIVTRYSVFLFLKLLLFAVCFIDKIYLRIHQKCSNKIKSS